MCCSILLVGDVRQHQAGEAGTPFEQLQKHGMTTVELSENVRQRTKLKQTVQKLAARHTPEAVAELISRGKVIEIADERERFEAIAQDYAKNPIGTLVISPANRERPELNWLIHGEKLKVKAGEYARVVDTDHERNKITVLFDDGRTLRYNPTRLSGVSVYYEAERTFAEGKRGGDHCFVRVSAFRKIVTNEKRQVLQPAASR